jgi:hypothetical protein
MSKHTFKAMTQVWDAAVDNWVMIPVDITVDVEAVARKLAGRAFRSKAGRATAMHSAIVAKIIPKT